MADQNEIPNLSIGNVFDREKVMGDIARTIELGVRLGFYRKKDAQEFLSKLPKRTTEEVRYLRSVKKLLANYSLIKKLPRILVQQMEEFVGMEPSESYTLFLPRVISQAFEVGESAADADNELLKVREQWKNEIVYEAYSNHFLSTVEKVRDLLDCSIGENKTFQHFLLSGDRALRLIKIVDNALDALKDLGEQGASKYVSKSRKAGNVFTAYDAICARYLSNTHFGSVKGIYICANISRATFHNLCSAGLQFLSGCLWGEIGTELEGYLDIINDLKNFSWKIENAEVLK